MASQFHVPDRWRIVRLGDVADVTFSSVDKKTLDDELPVELCNYTDVFYNRQIRPGMDLMVATATPTEREKWTLKKGDVLFTKDSETRDEIGIPAYVPEDMPNVLCGYHLGRARPDSRVVDGSFLARALGSPASARELARVANGITRFGLTLDATRSLLVLLPPLGEQRAIAAVLDSIDEVIERTGEVIAATKRLRDATLHELLSCGLPGRNTEWKEIRGLGTIPASWDVMQLGEILTLNQPGAWGDAPTEDDSGVRVLRAADLTRDGGVITTSAAWRCLSQRDRERRLMINGDLLLERSGGGPGTPVGRIALIDGVSPIYCSNFCQHLRVDSARCSPQFAARALWHRYMRGVTERLEQRTTGIRNLDYDGYLLFPIPLPPLDEQRTITTALDGVDEALARIQAERDELQSLKESVTDALLTGRVQIAATVQTSKPHVHS